jgi:sec-independent protein translocase protein TatC
MTDPQDSLDEQEEELEEATLLSHLVELRSRLLKASAGVLLVFVCLVPFAQQIFTAVAQPLMRQLPEESTMIATQVAAPFLHSVRRPVHRDAGRDVPDLGLRCARTVS